MRQMRTQVVVVLGMSLLVAAIDAHAQTSVQLATGVNYSTGDYDQPKATSVVVVPFNLRLVNGNWSLRASVPFLSVKGPADVSVLLDDNGGGRGSSGSGGMGRDHPEDKGSVAGTGRVGPASGIGDVSLSTTYSFNRIRRSAVYVDVTGRVRLPTGDEDQGLGVGATDYGLATEVGYDGARGGTYISLGRRFLGDVNGLDRQDGWQAGAGTWRNLGKNASIGAGYNWRESSVVGGKDPAEISAYVTRRLNRAWRVGVNGSVGLNSASADYSVGFTVTWRDAERR